MKTEPKRVVCVACNRLIFPSKNGRPRRHSPHNGFQGHGHPATRGTCAGVEEPGIDPKEDTMAGRAQPRTRDEVPRTSAGRVKCSRRCPGCGKGMTTVLGETIPRHEARRRSWTRRGGDFWCGAQGLKLVGVRPMRWERAGPGPEEERAKARGE